MINNVFCHGFTNECHVFPWDRLSSNMIFSSKRATATSMLLLIPFASNSRASAVKEASLWIPSGTMADVALHDKNLLSFLRPSLLSLAPGADPKEPRSLSGHAPQASPWACANK